MGRLSLKLGISTSWNPQRLSRPVVGLIYLLGTNLFNITDVWYTPVSYYRW